MPTSTISPCFTPGTLIATDRGHRPVETLRRGDRLVTRDNGLRRIYWVGRRDVGFAELSETPEIAPVLVRAGSLGQGAPARDMIVSPNHRFLVGRDMWGLDTNEPEALIAARRLIDQRSVHRAAMLGVSYIHVLCDRHQVILANGAWTESFHPDDKTMLAMGNSQRLEILQMFPEIATIGAAARFPAARPILGERSRFER